MNNGKRRRVIYEVANEITKELVDSGKLIEAGFAAFAHLVIPRDASTLQVTEMQMAFMAGADHLWSSVMTFLEEGQDPTDKDMQRMTLVQKEVDEWRARLLERMPPSPERP